MFYWKRIAPGLYEARRNGEVVATCERVKDTGEPKWELSVSDGTVIDRRGRTFGDFYTLGEAQFAYGRAYRLTNESD